MFMNKVYTGQYKGRVNLLGVSWYLMKKIVFDHLIKQKISTGIDFFSKTETINTVSCYHKSFC